MPWQPELAGTARLHSRLGMSRRGRSPSGRLCSDGGGELRSVGSGWLRKGFALPLLGASVRPCGWVRGPFGSDCLLSCPGEVTRRSAGRGMRVRGGRCLANRARSHVTWGLALQKRGTPSRGPGVSRKPPARLISVPTRSPRDAAGQRPPWSRLRDRVPRGRDWRPDAQVVQNQGASALIASSSRALSAGIRVGREKAGPLGRGLRNRGAEVRGS